MKKQNKPTRRHTQAANRQAFAERKGLVPMPSRVVIALPVPDAKIIDFDNLPEQEQNEIATDLWSMPVPDGLVERVKAGVQAKLDNLAVDQVVDMPDAKVVVQTAVTTKPKGSNAWPWNRKLSCCNQIEKNCTCGPNRVYFYE